MRVIAEKAREESRLISVAFGCAMERARLILEDGFVFDGFCCGAARSTSGELVFQTGMVGYCEALTDKSYYGQLLVLTYPLIGNYGVPDNDSDEIHQILSFFESNKIWARALIVSSLCPEGEHSHWNAKKSLNQWLKENGITCLTGVDTRKLTKHLRERGSMAGKIIVKSDNADAYPFEYINEFNLVERVSTTRVQQYGFDQSIKPHVMVVDCGMKYNQLRCLLNRGAKVTVVPWNYKFSSEDCDGIFLSNGPGDPEKYSAIVDEIRLCFVKKDKVPIMGVCLGHQLLAVAAGAKTYRMKFGNRSHNQPCLLSSTNRCLITSQNHGYAVDEESIPQDWEALFTNANDKSNEGIAHRTLPYFGVQFHPEHFAGPDDSEFLFDIFLEAIRRHKEDGCERICIKHSICAHLNVQVSPASYLIKKRKVLVLGSGGLTIGQAGEFDYSGSQALKSLKEENIQTVLVNPNIATVQTMKGFADFTYFLPITPAYVKQVLKSERPDGILLSFGGQTALNCGVDAYNENVFADYDVTVLGTSVETIVWTEDRNIFAQKMTEIHEPVVSYRTAKSVNEAIAAAKELGYPVLVRATYSLGGFGSGIANDEVELKKITKQGLSASCELLIDKSLFGWKEFEYEVVRDVYNNCAVICNMENVDPVGIHTGESVVTAPSQTLSSGEYFKLRQVAIKIAAHLNIIGECNVQFAVNPKQFEYYVIEVNARLSRSSALASKATGYPLAYVAAKLSLGYPLPKVVNTVTSVTTACFEPSLDYCVVKMPRWDLNKFHGVSTTIGSCMKSIGEVMGVGRNFEEAFQKALRMTEESVAGFDPALVPVDLDKVKVPTDKRLFYIASALYAGHDVDTLSRASGIDPWFIHRMNNMVNIYKTIQQNPIDASLLRHAKVYGFSDRLISACCGSTELAVRKMRQVHNIRPFFKQIDTLAAEWPAKTNYLYSTYDAEENDVEALPGSHMVLGSGVYRIGSSVEFDCCAVGCVRELKAAGYQTIMINCNPETVSTDYDVCDRLIFEEISLEVVLDAYDAMKPCGLILCMGGQLSNNIALNLSRQKVKIFGTHPDFIDRAENRYKFSRTLDELNESCSSSRDRISQPRWKELVSIESAKAFCHDVGYPCLIRPSYVLSGAAMNVAHSDEDLETYLQIASGLSKDRSVVISKFISEAKEMDVDAVAVSGKVACMAISEHVENAGVHSGDATLVTPTQDINLSTLNDIQRIVKCVACALQVTGPLNLQLIAKDDKIHVIECNVRASRSFPFVSKVLGYDFIAAATKAVVGLPLEHAGIVQGRGVVGVKVPQFSFARLSGAEVTLGVEMRSTGEVACFGSDRYEAYLKAMLSTGFEIPAENIFLSIGSYKQKKEMLSSVKCLEAIGYRLFASMGTADFYREHGVKIVSVEWPFEEGGPYNGKSGALSIADYVNMKKFDLVINLPMRGSGFSRVSSFMTPGYKTRRQAIDNGIPLITDIKCAKLMAEALKRMHRTAPVVISEIDRISSHFIVRLPGLIDIHTHMRDPGGLQKEDWTTGTMAALAGGITMVLAMPNTNPAVDSEETYHQADKEAREKACCDYGLYVCATKSNAGTLSTIANQSTALKMFMNETYTQYCISNDIISLSKHFETWPKGKLIVAHAEGQTVSTLMWLTYVYQRPVHVCHVSSRQEITIIKTAKERGLPVTCEVTPHHLFLNRDSIAGPLSNVRPALGTQDDCDALWENMDIIDCFATDHAPHTVFEKLSKDNPPGFPGLETMLSLLINAVYEGRLALKDVVARLYDNPRRIFNLPNQPNTYVEVDLDEEWTVPEKTKFCKSQWTPFTGMQLRGVVRRVVLRGEEVFIDGQVLAKPGYGVNIFKLQDVEEPYEGDTVQQSSVPPSAIDEELRSIRKHLSETSAGAPPRSLYGQHVIDVAMFDKQMLRKIFSIAQHYMTIAKSKDEPITNLLKGRVMATLFFEPSTRTQCSFSASMQRLGGSVVSINSSASSLQKGESLEDTVAVMSSYADILVIRHSVEGSVEAAACVSSVPVINAGDGAGGHPTQALLDIFTIREEIGTVNELTIALVGDLKNSRTVHSLAMLLCLYRVNIVYVSLPGLEIPEKIKGYVSQFDIPQRTCSLREAIRDCDVLYMTRLQKERQCTEHSAQAYNLLRITPELMRLAKEKMIVMHPLPRVDEIDSAVDTDPRAAYFRQARYGLYVRMALITMILEP